MKKLLLFGLLCSFCVSLIYPGEDKPNPEQQTMNCEQLIKQLGADDGQTRDKARQELEKIGAEAIPFLRKALKNTDAEIKQASRGLIGKIRQKDEMTFAEKLAGNNGLYESMIQEFRDCIMIGGIIRDAASLQECFPTDPAVRESFLKLLIANKDKDIPRFLPKYLEDDCFKLREFTFKLILNDYRSLLDKYMTDILDDMATDDDWFRPKAQKRLFKLLELGKPIRDAFLAKINNLNDKERRDEITKIVIEDYSKQLDMQVRERIIQISVKIEKGCSSLSTLLDEIPEEYRYEFLLSVVEHKEISVRRQAISGLSECYPNKVPIAIFTKAISDNQATIRGSAVSSLASVQGKTSLPYLLHMLQDKDLYVRHMVVWSILSHIDIKEEDVKIIRSLIDALDNNEEKGHEKIWCDHGSGKSADCISNFNYDIVTILMKHLVIDESYSYDHKYSTDKRKEIITKWKQWDKMNGNSLKWDEKIKKFKVLNK